MAPLLGGPRSSCAPVHWTAWTPVPMPLDLSELLTVWCDTKSWMTCWCLMCSWLNQHRTVVIHKFCGRVISFTSALLFTFACEEDNSRSFWQILMKFLLEWWDARLVTNDWILMVMRSTVQVQELLIGILLLRHMDNCIWISPINSRWPRVGSGFVRIDLLHFVAECRTRWLNQV